MATNPLKTVPGRTREIVGTRLQQLRRRSAGQLFLVLGSEGAVADALGLTMVEVRRQISADLADVKKAYDQAG